MNKNEIDETKKLIIEVVEEREKKEKEIKENRNFKIVLGFIFSFIFGYFVWAMFVSGVWTFTTGFLMALLLVLWIFTMHKIIIDYPPREVIK
jgi:hypothetical protein